MYLFIYTVRDVVASHTSGHTALDAWNRWWMYGILVAVYLKANIPVKHRQSSQHQADLLVSGVSTATSRSPRTQSMT
jgi:hypothetical protein